MFKKRCAISLLSLLTIFAFAEEPLPVDEAFAFAYQIKAPDKVLLSWQIAEGHYLYKQKFKFVSLNSNQQLEKPVFPVTETKQDKTFGNVEVYRTSLTLDLTLLKNEKDIEIIYQGCSDDGLCYLPVHKTLNLSF